MPSAWHSNVEESVEALGLGARSLVESGGAAVQQSGAPRHLRSDHSGEFIAHTLRQRLEDNGVTARDIEPGRFRLRPSPTRAAQEGW